MTDKKQSPDKAASKRATTGELFPLNLDITPVGTPENWIRTIQFELESLQDSPDEKHKFSNYEHEQLQLILGAATAEGFQDSCRVS